MHETSDPEPCEISVEGSVCVVTEFLATELPTGVERRLMHVQTWLDDSAIASEYVILNPFPRADVGLLRRFSSAFRFQWPEEHRNQELWFVGLGSPTMLIAAARAAHRGYRVRFDVCDSSLLQVGARWRNLATRDLLIALVLVLIQIFVPKDVKYSYISTRDLRADRLINRGRASSVVPPCADVSLKDLDPPLFPLERLVVVAELGSFHNRRGWEMLVSAARTGGLPVPIWAYGPSQPSDDACQVVEYKGWAKSLSDIYDGNVGVIVTNVGGSGIPNKLLEAVAARRPVLVHVSMVDIVPVDADYWTYHDAESLILSAINMVSRTAD